MISNTSCFVDSQALDAAHRNEGECIRICSPMFSKYLSVQTSYLSVQIPTNGPRKDLNCKIEPFMANIQRFEVKKSQVIWGGVNILARQKKEGTRKFWPVNEGEGSDFWHALWRQLFKNDLGL